MEAQGPFDRVLQTEPPPRRDSAAVFVVVTAIILGIILLILVLPPISILDDDGGTVETVISQSADQMPPPPAGFRPVSPLYEFSSSGEVEGLALSLSTSVASGTPLVFFTYAGDEWVRVSDAVAVGDGRLAVAEGITEVPENLAVFTSAEAEPGAAAGSITTIGFLPPNAELDQRAVGILDIVSPASYVPIADGTVSGGIGPLPPELPAGVAPTVSAAFPAEADAVNTILASPDLRTAHVQALASLVAQNGYAGVHLDYRAVDPNLGADFTTFVQELAGVLGDRHLSLMLPLPVREGEAWTTLGYDWGALAGAADLLVIVPVADQDVYYQQMEAVLGFLTAEVPPEKLAITISPLSLERSVDGIRPLRLTEALGIAAMPVLQTDAAVVPEASVRALGQNLAQQTGGNPIAWDDTARSLAFTYTGPGGERRVWIANRFSEAFRLELAQRYGLGGIAVEDASVVANEPNLWGVLGAYANEGRLTLTKPNAELLEPQWTADGGSFENDRGAAVTWHAPAEPGTYVLTLIVSDGVTRAARELPVVVEAAPAAP